MASTSGKSKDKFYKLPKEVDTSSSQELDSQESVHCSCISKDRICTCPQKQCAKCSVLCHNFHKRLTAAGVVSSEGGIHTPQPVYVYENPVHESPHDSCNSDSNSSIKLSLYSTSKSQVSSGKSQIESQTSQSSDERSKNSMVSSPLPKLSIPIRSQYQKLESTSITEQCSQTCSGSLIQGDKLFPSNQLTSESTSASQILFDQSYSQLSSTISATLTPTPLHALPHSSTELSSSNNHEESPLSPISSPIFCSPPLSPITPLTNTITPSNTALKKARSKKSIEKASGSSQYIFVAAHQISEAQEHEKRNELAEAVAKYREGVGTLLQGVQEGPESSTVLPNASSATNTNSTFKGNKGEDEANIARREGVRRKTFQYLQRAEQLLSRLTRQSSSTTMPGPPQLGDKDTTAAEGSGGSSSGLQCGEDVLRQYRVLGVAPATLSSSCLCCCCVGVRPSKGILIAQLPHSKLTVALKVILKSSSTGVGASGRGRSHGSSASSPATGVGTANNVIPRGVPHIVPVICYHETDSAIYLVMKYISGGRLWDHIHKYVNQPIPAPVSPPSFSPPSSPRTASVGNAYRGRRLLIDPCQDKHQSEGSKQSPQSKVSTTKVAENLVKTNNLKARGNRAKDIQVELTVDPLEVNVNKSTDNELVINEVDRKPTFRVTGLSDTQTTLKGNTGTSDKMLPKITHLDFDIHLSNQTKLDSLDIMSRSFKESLESPSTQDPKSAYEGPSSLLDPITYDPTTMDNTSMFSSRFTTDSAAVVALSGMARYKLVDSSSCASDTTIGAEYCWEEEEGESAPRPGLQGTGAARLIAFEDNHGIVATTSERQVFEGRPQDLSVTSERQTKTSPIACLGKSELNLCGSDLDYFPGHFVSKSVSADDLTLHSISGMDNANIQHSTISTVNVIPLVPKIRYNNQVDNGDVTAGTKNGINKEEDDNVSVGSDTLSGVSDDFSCSLSLNQLTEDKKALAAVTSAGAMLPSEPNLLSECAVSEGCKRPTNTPDSAYAFMKCSEMGALKSLCQSTSCDVTTDITLEQSAATMENSLFNSATLNDCATSNVRLSVLRSTVADKEVHVEKLVSFGGNNNSGKSSGKSGSSVSAASGRGQPRTETSSSDLLVKKLFKSNSDELNVDKFGAKTDDERCPSEPTSISSVTLPSFSASHVVDRSGSEVASFDIEELIRNSRRLLQNVDMTLEQSKGKSVKPVPSEDSSTSIDQSELPLDSVSVGFDTPDIPSNSTRCSNVSSDIHHHSKPMADNTYSSIPSIALDTSRHALNPSAMNVNDNSASLDKALRSPRLQTVAVTGGAETKADAAVKEVEVSSGDSFISCDGNRASKETSSPAAEGRAFLTLPKESITSKEDSTNPSDVHTQIHLSNTADNAPKEEEAPKGKMAMLERQANFEKSDTSRSSIQKSAPRENALDKLMKTIGINKQPHESRSASNDSTSISGLTLNQTESGGVPSVNGSTRPSSSILSRSLDELSMTNTNEVLSSESTYGLKYYANPNDTDKAFLIVTDTGQGGGGGAVSTSGLVAGTARSKSTSKVDQPLSEPLYLLPQKDRSEIMNKSEPVNQDRLLDPPYQGVKNCSGRTTAASNYITASLQGSKSSCNMAKKSTQVTSQNFDSDVIGGNSKLQEVHSPESPARPIGRDSVTESFSMHSCLSEMSRDEMDGNAVCVTDSTNSTATKCSTDIDTYTTSTMTGTNTTNTATLSKSKSKKATQAAFAPVQGRSATKQQHKTKKISVMRQTPLAELLEKHYRGGVGTEEEGEQQDRRHLPEGLVKVWGAQVVSAVSALHDLGIVWGDLGPHNLLLGEGGCVLLTLETRWAAVDRQRPGASHSRATCSATGRCRRPDNMQSTGKANTIVSQLLKEVIPSEGINESRNIKCQSSEKESLDDGISRNQGRPTRKEEVLDLSSAQSNATADIKNKDNNNHFKSLLQTDAVSPSSDRNKVQSNYKQEAYTVSTSTVFHKSTGTEYDICPPPPLDQCPTCPEQTMGGIDKLSKVSQEGSCNHNSDNGGTATTSDVISSQCCGSCSRRALCGACLGYIAPEVRSPLYVPTPASDWWSVGALFYHLLTGQNVASQHPTGFTSHTELRLPAHLSAEAALLLSQLLTAHPSERLGGGPTGAQEIRHHPFFSEAPWPY